MASALEPDTTSPSYQTGYEQGLSGREFRCANPRNPYAANDHYFGFVKGKSERLGIPYDWRNPSPEWLS